MIKSIYVIKRKDNFNIVYVGSTSSYISRRKAKHRHNYNNNIQYEIYKYMRDNGGFDAFFFELYEKFEGTNDELHRREGQIILQLMNNQEQKIYNTNIAGRTQAESVKNWTKNNWDYIVKYQKNYQEEYRKLKKEKKLSSSSEDLLSNEPDDTNIIH